MEKIIHKSENSLNPPPPAKNMGRVITLISVLLTLLASCALFGADTFLSNPSLIMSNSTPITDGSETVYWLNPLINPVASTDKYQTNVTSQYDDSTHTYSNIFTDSLGIKDGISLLAKGRNASDDSPFGYIGLNLAGNFYQTGGKVEVVTDGAPSVGIYMLGNYNLSGGELIVKADGSSYGDISKGIYLVGGNFNMSGGSVKTRSADDTGIYLDTGNFYMNNGKLNVDYNGIALGSGNFYMQSPNILNTAQVIIEFAMSEGGTGIELETGDFIMTSGTLEVKTKNGSRESYIGKGINILDGNFNISGGTLALSPTFGDMGINTNPSKSYGVYIGNDPNTLDAGGKLNITDNGNVNANARKTETKIGHLYGVYAEKGITVSDNGYISGAASNDSTATEADAGTNNVYGIYIADGDFVHNGKAFQATALNQNPLLSTVDNNNYAYGLYMEKGDMIIQITEAMDTYGDGVNNYGAYLKNGSVTQNSGFFNPQAYKYGYGMYLEDGNMTIKGGAFRPGGRLNATGMYLKNGNVTLEGGKISANGSADGNDDERELWGAGDSVGLLLENGNVIQTGGEIIAWSFGGTVDGATAAGIRINGDNKFIQEAGGFLEAQGYGKEGIDAFAYGINIEDGTFETKGTVCAYGEGDNGYGIYAKNFNQSTSGTIYMWAGTGTSISVENANLSGILRPEIDFQKDTNGYFFGNTITINDNGSTSKLIPYLYNSLLFDKTGQYHRDILFMTSDAGNLTKYRNAYQEPEKTITMNYGTRIVGGEDYYLTIERYRMLSEAFADGGYFGESALAKWMEDNSEALFENSNSYTYNGLITAYSNGDMSYGADEAAEYFESENIVPETATKRLHAIGENLLDSTPLRLTVHNDRTELLPLNTEVRDGFWVTPVGSIMNFYPDKKRDRGFYYGAGLNIGFAGYLNNNSSYGIGLTYANGYYDDGDTNFGRVDTSFASGALGYRTNPGLNKVWVEGTATYAVNSADAYAEFGKTKSDAYRIAAKVGKDIASGENWRFTPALGVDYTFYDYNESIIADDLLAMRIKDTESLRGKAEVEAVYNTKETTRFGVKLGYSYESLGSGIEQEMDLILADNPITLTTKTERSARHNGHLGLSVNHRITDTTSFAAEYDLSANDLMTTNNLRVNLKLVY